MTRAAGVVVALLCCLSPAGASLSNSKPFHQDKDLRATVLASFTPEKEEVPTPGEVTLTDDTEVILDGRKCEYKDVPATASIAAIALAKDGRTVIRIEFKTGK